VIAVAICATAAGIASLSTTDDQRQAGDIVIDVRNVVYPDMTIPSGANVLFIDNHDLIRHTLLIEEAGTDIEIPGGTARRVRLDLTPGVYQYICDVAGHDRMRGTITVTDDSVEIGP
jgi:plastocyanin